MFKGVAWEQISGFVQRALMFGAGIAVARGWITAEQATLVVGAMVTLLGVAWGIKVNTEKALTRSVNGLSSVQGIVTTNTTAGRALAASIPDETVASAGTTAAAKISKPN